MKNKVSIVKTYTIKVTALPKNHELFYEMLRRIIHESASKTSTYGLEVKIDK